MNPSVIDTTHSTISLTWTAPASDGGSPVIGYLVECKRANTADWIRCNIPRNLQDTSYVIQNLIDKNEYQCRITAVNKVGFSEPVEVPGKHVAKDIIGKNTSPVFGVKFCLGLGDIKPAYFVYLRCNLGILTWFPRENCGAVSGVDLRARGGEVANPPTL